jgi:dihydrofolate reductase
MRKVMYAMNVSLDGYIESSEGLLDWSFPDEELHRHFNDLERGMDVLLYGRGLYQTMAGFWPTADEDPTLPPYVLEYAQIWMSKPKIVFSTTLDKVSWNSTLVRGNIVEEVERLRNQPGNYLSVGGAGLASAFMRLGLIDEYWVYYTPVILGGGKPMFPTLKDRINLALVETRTFKNGVVLLRLANAAGSPG